MSTNMTGFGWFSKAVCPCALDESSLTVDGLNNNKTYSPQLPPYCTDSSVLTSADMEHSKKVFSGYTTTVYNITRILVNTTQINHMIITYMHHGLTYSSARKYSWSTLLVYNIGKSLVNTSQIDHKRILYMHHGLTNSA